MKKDTISRNIGLLMEHFGIRNESQLAKQVNMPQTTINKLLSGVSSDPHISTLTPIIEYFKISLDTLLSETPIFSSASTTEPQDLLVPLITYDELVDVYDDLSSLNSTNWPHWYPIPKQKNNDYYVVHLTQQRLSKPFDQASLLIVQHSQTLQNNIYCLVKHLPSNSLNIKKAHFENGKEWLLTLQPELPTSEFDVNEWLLLGNIQAVLIDMTNGSFIQMEGEQN